MHTVIDDLKVQGLQSDDRFTEAYIHSRIQRGYGPVRIRQELRERRVSGDLIDQYVDVSEFNWKQHALQVREKKFGHSLPSSYKDKAKQSRFLQYRGFTGDQIKYVFNDGDE